MADGWCVTFPTDHISIRVCAETTCTVSQPNRAVGFGWNACPTHAGLENGEIVLIHVLVRIQICVVAAVWRQVARTRETYL